MADRQGFEPWERSPAHTLSKRAPSTTRPPVRSIALIGTSEKVLSKQSFIGAKPATQTKTIDQLSAFMLLMKRPRYTHKIGYVSTLNCQCVDKILNAYKSRLKRLVTT